MAEVNYTESIHTGCLSILSSCFRPSGHPKSLISKNVDKRATSAQGTSDVTAKPTTSSSALAPNQNSCDPDHIAATVQHENGDHGLATSSQAQHLPASTNVSELWYQALEQSDEETKEKINQLGKTEKSIQIDQLINLICDKRDAFKADTPSIKVHGKEVIWRDCAARVISVLTILGDVATQFAPSPSSAIWSALKTNVTQCAEMVAVLGCIEKVLPIVKRGAIYEHVFLRERSENSRKSSINLKEALVEAYKQALKLLVQAERKVEENSIVRFWYTLQNPEDVVGLIKDFRDAEDRVIRDAHACHVEQGKANHDEILERFGSLDRPLRDLSMNISNAEYGEALRFVSQIHVGNQHHERTRRRLSGTGEWLLQHRYFLQWRQSASSEILWLTGQVGAGKSVLASHVVDRCMDDDVAGSQEIGTGLAFFYYSKADQEIRDEPSTCVLRSFLRQLFTLPCCSARLQRDLMHRIGEAQKSHRTFLNHKECESLLLDFVNGVPRTFLILDGLDEFSEQDGSDVVIALQAVLRKSRGSVKLFISSRDESRIRKTFYATVYQQPLLEINISHENKTDIEKFVETETTNNFNRYAADRQRLLTERLVSGANGMFRWAYLQVEQLKSCKSWKAVLQRLDNLPKGLTQAYDELYDKNEGPDKTYLQRAVKWVMFARQPLSTFELLSAVQLGQSAEGMLQIDNRLEEAELENICRHLISKDQYNTWKFPHASVKEYFQDKENKRLEDWIGDIGRLDLAILLVLLFTGYDEWPDGAEPNHYDWFNESYDLSPFTSGSRPHDPQDSLRFYVDRNWKHHVETIQHLPIEQSQRFQLLKPFISPGKSSYQASPQYQKWVHSSAVKYTPFNLELADKARDSLPAENSIFGIVAQGFFPILQKGGIGSLNLEQTNAKGLSLLAIAASHGLTETCARLIDIGCNVNRIFRVSYKTPLGPVMYDSTALFEAVRANKPDCVQLILSNKADTNFNTDTRALCKAAGYYDITMLKLLLDHGAEVNAVCHKCEFDRAFDRAVYFNQTEAMELLTQAGAHPELLPLNDSVEYRTSAWVKFGPQLGDNEETSEEDEDMILWVQKKSKVDSREELT